MRKKLKTQNSKLKIQIKKLKVLSPYWLRPVSCVLVGLFFISVLFGPVGHILVRAESGYEEQYDELKERENKKAELEQKIADTLQQEKTLANQIAYLENQISLTILEQEETRDQIEETQNQLELVGADIERLSGKLDNLNISIGDLDEVLSARIRESYQVEMVGSGLILDLKNIQQAILQSAYLKALQKEDNRLLSKMRDTKQVYETQKAELEDLKLEKEELKVQLESQNNLLEQQKADFNNQQSAKVWLLDVTRNEERQYQILLAQVEEEIRAIRAALVSLGTEIGEVKQGDVIAHVGNTGCSTGPHLHFGYYVGGVAVNPMPLLYAGEFIWPVDDPVITQGFNDPNTREWYQANFGINGHNGVDFVDGAVGAGAPVLAVADGVAYLVGDSRACWLTGTVGQGIRIDHSDGTKTIYWHVQ